MFIPKRSLRNVTPLLCGSGILVFALLVITVVQAFPKAAAHVEFPPVADGRVRGGSLVIAGGGYVTPEIRRRFLELAGGSEARIVVIPATDPAPGQEDSWVKPWRALGVSHVDFCNASDRATANSAKFCAALRRATGVWMSGGYQELLASRYVDTAVQKCLHDVLDRNGVVGGCSAGAAILSRVMIKEGEDEPVEARGLDLIANAIVDQHFLQRNRLWRLQQMLETHPDLIGFGVDENTALVVQVSSGRLSVVGDSYAMVCVPPVGPHAARLEVLKSGDDFLLSELKKAHMAYHAPPMPVVKPTVLAVTSHSA